ncbi:MAG TPA: SHOCT domain-containing protein [Burkholderiaceae bacterium]|jgi:hypothetical protein|nr:SHOCT domain-containing protein [Burkholderiaceae bacterium]
MHSRSMFFPTLLILAATVSGCASNPGIVKTSSDTYMLTRTDKGGSLSDVATTKADMVREAKDFAAGQGKVVVPVAMKDTPMTFPGFTSVEYRFQIVDKADVPAQPAMEAKRTDFVPAKASGASVDTRTVGQQDHPRDIYTELIKLDDLRKRGILTDAEFDSQKKKILDSN